MAAAAKLVNPNAEIVAKSQSLLVNVSAGRGLASVLKSNLGPRGTLKMLVGGAGQIKLTKDGAVLLKEMQIMRPTAPQFFDQERVGAHTLAGRSLRRHPTATMIARTATAQDEITGDGTTSVVLLTGELLKCAERYVGEGMHPRVIAEGYDLARDKALEILDACAVGVDAKNPPRELLQSVARTALRTKLQPKIADLMTGAVVDAVLTVRDEDDEGSLAVDLHMVEVMTMEHKLGADSRFVRGLVLDHASRHPDMPKRLTNCRRRGAEIGPDRDGVAPMASPWSRVFVRNVFAIASGPRGRTTTPRRAGHVLTCNVSLEYEKSEVASGFYYSNAEQRERLIESERKFTDDKVKQVRPAASCPSRRWRRRRRDDGDVFAAAAESGRAPQVIEFKRRVCKEGESFVVINQKGIDPLSLDMLAKEGIWACRRAKRRNMERIALACGGSAVNCLDDLEPDCLGHTGLLYEVNLGEENYTFIDEVKNPKSCTLLLKGPNKHTIDQIKDAVRDGLRAVAGVLEDGKVVPGGGAFEVAAAAELVDTFTKTEAARGKKKFGIHAYADALLVVPKVLAENAGLDVQEAIVNVQDARIKTGGCLGLDLATGEATDTAALGVWDNYRVKKQYLHLSTVLATQLLLVDEVMKAGRTMGKGPAAAPDDEYA